MAITWRDALFKLDNNGWDSDDIESACEALSDACDEGEYGGNEVGDLSATDVMKILSVDLSDEEATALRVVGGVLTHRTAASEALRRALYDLDAFVYAPGSDEDP